MPECAHRPPSATKNAPVTNEASSDARNKATLAISCGSPYLRPQNYRLAWHSPYGPIMMLAQVYRQENGFFAAVVVAGVKDNAPEAMGAAEWALSRLSSG